MATFHFQLSSHIKLIYNIFHGITHLLLTQKCDNDDIELDYFICFDTS